MTADTSNFIKRMRTEPWEKLDFELREVEGSGKPVPKSIQAALDVAIWDLDIKIGGREQKNCFLIKGVRVI